MAPMQGAVFRWIWSMQQGVQEFTGWLNIESRFCFTSKAPNAFMGT